jgi:hypothetical protein
MSKRISRSAQSGTSILGRIFENGRGGMSPTVARQILKFGFNQADQDRMADLAERNQLGTLSPAEKAELMEYVDAGHVLSILHSLARMALEGSRTVKA